MLNITTIEKAPGACNTGGFDNQTIKQDSATHGDMPKAVFTLGAQLALRGHSVHPLPGAGYVVSKHSYTYHAKDFADLQGFAEELGV